MKRITYMDAVEQFKRQGVDRKDWAVICPMCGTVQSCSDLINAGAGDDLETVNPYFGYSCVGRFNEETGCDWTLGGLFQIHQLEVEKDGKIHPLFEIASAEQAQANVKKNQAEEQKNV